MTPSTAQVGILEAARDTLAAMAEALLEIGLEREALAVILALRGIGAGPDDRLH